MIVVVAGGIGTGKSAVIKILEDLNAKVVSADSINRELLNDNTYIEKIGSTFSGIVKNGKIDKKSLRNLIFNDEDSRLKLNSIAHPLIFSKISEMVCSLPLVFIEIPLFIECRDYIKYDILWAVRASNEIRATRVAQRDNISISSAYKIIDAQYRENEIYDMADFIIHNDGDLDNLKEQVIAVYNKCLIK